MQSVTLETHNEYPQLEYNKLINSYSMINIPYLLDLNNNLIWIILGKNGAHVNVLNVSAKIKIKTVMQYPPSL